MSAPSLSELPLGLIADSGVVGVVLWDASGAIHEANDHFLELLGYSASDLPGGGLAWLDLTPAERRGIERQDIERLMERRIARSEEKQYLRKDGSPVFARLHSAALGDGSARILSILVDVSVQKRAEAELRILVEREVAARAEAEIAVRSRDDILAIVSHDLRNPLSVISMSAALLESPLPGEKRTAQIGIIRRAVAGMNRLIADLMDVSQITRGGLRINTTALDPADICRDARALFDPLLSSKSQEFRCACDADGAAVIADRERVAQVLSNLIGNAHKFTPEGGRIELRAIASPEDVRFSVRDTGPGLSSEDLPHAFDRFWQARRVRRGGVGLGLPITKGIVDAHGGRIWVESSAGVGTTFHFTLPRAAAENFVRIQLPTERRPNVQGHVTDEPPEHGGAPAPQPGSRPAAMPTDAQLRAKALSRWEGEGGALGRAASPGDALDDIELRILARVGAAALGEWAALPGSLREAMLASICRPLVPGDGARAKSRIAKFLEENANRC